MLTRQTAATGGKCFRSPGSLAVQRRDALGLAVGGKRDFLDPHFRVLQQGVATRFQRLAALVELDRFLERDRAFFQPIDDRLQLRERRLERHLFDIGVLVGHVGPSEFSDAYHIRVGGGSRARRKTRRAAGSPRRSSCSNRSSVACPCCSSVTETSAAPESPVTSGSSSMT